MAGRACGWVRMDKEYVQNWWINLFGNAHLEDHEGDGRMTLRRILGI
jgi:hypothetical protein